MPTERDQSADPIPAKLKAGIKLGHYNILSRLGTGGMGEVWLAEDSRLGRKVAVKPLLGKFASDPERLRRFETEARAASATNHPNIVTIFEIGNSNGISFIAQEFVDGETLRNRLARGPIPLIEALDISYQVANALATAHGAGIIHRDIKPENIMLAPRQGDTDFVKILDFGLAKLVQPDIDAQRTTMGMTYGDPRYMAPEQARGEVVDRRGDIYSLGALGFEMLVGEPPFKGGGTFEVLQKVLDAPVPRVRERRSDCPPWLESIVRTALGGRDSAERTAFSLIRKNRARSLT